MGTTTALQQLCEKYDAIGFETWAVGIRFFLKSGKMSKIYSKKGLNLETGFVYVSRTNFEENYQLIETKLDPATKTKENKKELKQLIDTFVWYNHIPETNLTGDKSVEYAFSNCLDWLKLKVVPNSLDLHFAGIQVKLWSSRVWQSLKQNKTK